MSKFSCSYVCRYGYVCRKRSCQQSKAFLVNSALMMPFGQLARFRSPRGRFSKEGRVFDSLGRQSLPIAMKFQGFQRLVLVVALAYSVKLTVHILGTGGITNASVWPKLSVTAAEEGIFLPFFFRVKRSNPLALHRSHPYFRGEWGEAGYSTLAGPSQVVSTKKLEP